MSTQVREYVQRHRIDLALHHESLEPELPMAYSKLTILHRMARSPYAWLWWIDCDAIIVSPQASFWCPWPSP